MGKTLFIACAALGREVKAIIKKHDWDADFQAINARLHATPEKIGPAVEERLKESGNRYTRRIVVYGHCGAPDLDSILEKHGAVRPKGPHCFEMYGGEDFARTLREEPGTYILTDFLIRAWDSLVVQGLKIDVYPEMKAFIFQNYRQLVYYSQEQDDRLIADANEIAEWLELPLKIKHVEYGDLERRLVAIMEAQEQAITEMPDSFTGMAALPTGAHHDNS